MISAKQPRRLRKIRDSAIGNALYHKWCSVSPRPLLEGPRAGGPARRFMLAVQARAALAKTDARCLQADVIDAYIARCKKNRAACAFEPLALRVEYWLDRVMPCPPWPQEEEPGPEMPAMSVPVVSITFSWEDIVGFGHHRVTDPDDPGRPGR